MAGTVVVEAITEDMAVEDIVVGVTTEVGTVVMATVVIMEVIEDGVGVGGDGDGLITLPRIPILALQVLD